MKYEITGTTMQVVGIDLLQGEKIYSQTSCMSWMSDNIQMNTNTGGGLWAGIKRNLSGGSLFLTTFEAAQEGGHVAFSSKFPGNIMPVALKDGESLVCKKETFLCAEQSVKLEIAWQKNIGAGIFAGEGFILQRVTGPGTVWLDLAGETVVKDLAAGEKLLVHAGHIGVQTSSVTTDIQMIGGFKNILFGGEGLFLATLTGPGRIWLQSMSLMNLAESIAHYLPMGRQENAQVPASIAGGAIGGLLGLATMISKNE
jgi:uncharacterized protein (TIGR00266 family)